MVLAYQLEYNDRVIASGEAYNMEVLSYLDREFKDHVTVTVEQCLRTRPSDPVRFLAEHIRKLKTSTHGCEGSSKEEMSVSSSPLKNGSGDTEGEEASAARVDNSIADKSGMFFRFAGGVSCEVVAASLLSSPADTLPGVPLMHMVAPSVYEVNTALDHFEASAIPNPDTDLPTPTLVIVEPPAAPTEVVFLKGIPYYVSLTEQLQLHRRSGNGEAPVPSKGEDYTAKALQLLRDRLGGDLQTVEEAFCSAVIGSDFSVSHTANTSSARESAEMDVNAASMQSGSLQSGQVHPCDSARAAQRQSNEMFNSRRRLVVLPALQKNYLDVFDCIDTAFRAVMHPELMKFTERRHYGDVLDPIKSPYREPPSVLFISFNRQSASLTLSRVVAALLPYYDRTQRTKLAAMRDDNLARDRAHNLTFCANYWTEVHRRREERNENRGAAKRNLTRRGRNQPRSLSPQLTTMRGASSTVVTIAPRRSSASTPRPNELTTGTVKAVSRTSTPATLSVSARSTATQSHRSVESQNDPQRSELKKDVIAAREHRRQCEDTAFLEIVRLLRVRAVTRIQTIVRGRKVRSAYRNRLLHRKAGDGQGEKRVSSLYFDEEYHPDVPPMIRLCLRRLSNTHGEVFGNYPQSLPPAPRTLTVYRPVRNVLPATFEEDGESESEGWVQEKLLVPPLRFLEPPPHFNPLRRLLECARLANCTQMEDAMQLQRQCSGMSMLQRRAYDMIKSAVLSLLHVAYTELYHRRQLTYDTLTFSAFMRAHHSDVFGWFSQPHFVSRVELAAYGLRLRQQQRLQGGLQLSIKRLMLPVSAFDEQTLHYDRLLLAGSQLTNSFTAAPGNPAKRKDGKDFCRKLLGVNEDQQASKLQSGPSLVKCVAPCVYAVPAAPSVFQWIAALELIKQDMIASMTSTEVPTTTATATAAASDDDHDSEETALAGCVFDELSDTATNARDSAGSGGTGGRSMLNVKWWSLAPHPVVYVSGYSFVVAPRGSTQTVEGRPNYDEFVLRRGMDEAAATLAAQDGMDSVSFIGLEGAPCLGSTLPPATSAEEDAAGDSAAHELNMKGEQQLTNGHKNTVQTFSSCVASSTSAAAVPCRIDGGAGGYGSTLLLEFAGTSLVGEDDALAKLIEAEIASHGVLRYFHLPNEVEKAMKCAEIYQYYHCFDHSLLVSREFRLCKDDEHHSQPQRIGDHVSIASLGSATLSSLRISGGRAGGVTSAMIQPVLSRANCSGTSTVHCHSSVFGMKESAGVSPGWSSSVTSTRLAISPLVGGGQSEVNAAGGAAGDVERDEVEVNWPPLPDVATLMHMATVVVPERVQGIVMETVRPFLVPACFDKWVSRFHEYLEVCIAQLKVGDAVVLACEAPSQSFYVVAAAMATNAIARQKAAATNVMEVKTGGGGGGGRSLVSGGDPQSESILEILGNGSNTAIAAAPVARSKRCATLESGYSVVERRPVFEVHRTDAYTTDVHLGFLEEFYTSLLGLEKSSGVKLDECLSRTHSRIAECSSVDYLVQIAALVARAECEPNAQTCRKLITRTVQLTEHYCLLVLVELFLCLPFTRDALLPDKQFSLPSFAFFVKSLSTVGWIETIDPWKTRPECCPDVCHMRYSNWLRRWDSEEYICFGAW